MKLRTTPSQERAKTRGLMRSRPSEGVVDDEFVADAANDDEVVAVDMGDRGERDLAEALDRKPEPLARHAPFLGGSLERQEAGAVRAGSRSRSRVRRALRPGCPQWSRTIFRAAGPQSERLC